MANEEQLNILKQNTETWNNWRSENPDIKPDLSGADLSHLNLSGADLSSSNLSGASLRHGHLTFTNLSATDLAGTDLTEADLSVTSMMLANLSKANLSGATLNAATLIATNLSGAILTGATLIAANLIAANLSGADLSEANLSGAILTDANLSEAILTTANLTEAVLINSNLEKANLDGCKIYGVSAWDVKLTDAIQSNLIITPPETEAQITVDKLEVAQFIYLLLHNEKLRDVIDTIGKKAVLILGRFTDERKAVLEAIRGELRARKYIPIIFDFKKTTSKDLTETVMILAGMACFVIADITDAKSIPQELQLIVPNLPSVAIQPIILSGQYEYTMFEHFKRYPWVLPVYQYETQELLIDSLAKKVIQPAEAKVNEMRPGG